MAIERSWIKLSHDKDFVYSAVDAIAHRDVNKPIASTNRYLNWTASNMTRQLWSITFRKSFKNGKANKLSLKIAKEHKQTLLSHAQNESCDGSWTIRILLLSTVTQIHWDRNLKCTYKYEHRESV